MPGRFRVGRVSSRVGRVSSRVEVEGGRGMGNQGGESQKPREENPGGEARKGEGVGQGALLVSR